MAKGFVLVKDSATTVYKDCLIGTQTTAANLVTPGQLFDVNRGSATVEIAAATSSSTTSTIFGVAVSTQTLYDSTQTYHPLSDTHILVAVIHPATQLFTVDTTNNSNSAHNGQRMIVGADNKTINNTGSDVTGTTGIFQQVGIIGAVADKRIAGRFLPEHAA